MFSGTAHMGALAFAMGTNVLSEEGKSKVRERDIRILGMAA
jgi:hypothetical protein